ncbi:dipicolinate synthase subunit B [Sporolactobacillus laevolacticus]|jgi:dipicolinate synthase subunit B|uniref:Dihydrofolate reductase n=1 Tax=Sporolactobacillus laevolacticus DSM 442 TaxID=1395513 RepID=V6J1H6_9BACL|nr:dipicolinate synthase subunit B [Sporolactobacillus laevolacticus]EST13026.1 dihydrofolate reductase [Sporolactobacillus laevolacticus DSM 442]MDF2911430.1 dpaB [Sporolactobacillus laevolacticus]
MSLEGKHIGFGITGSHCTYSQVVPQIEKLIAEGCKVSAFVTYTVRTTDTRFGKASDWIGKVEEITGQKVVNSIVDAEPYGPKKPLDCMVIAPLTGNSMSKFANAQTDSPVLMAAKATLRNGSPVVLGVSTNDGLGLNLQNIAKLIVTKNIYFIPFGQDDPVNKPNSLVSHMDQLVGTVENAILGKQKQPILLEKSITNE